MNSLVICLNESELRAGSRNWTGNDEKGRNTHHGAVPLHLSPIDIRLAWRRNSSATVGLVGCFRLDLVGLLASGYIRPDPKPQHVRLKFVHIRDQIYIQIRSGAPALYVGDFADR
jgi:hypothetical protein